MTCDGGKVTVLMEKEETVADSQCSDQAINGAANSRPSPSQIPVNVGRIHIIRELCINFGKEK